MSADDIKKLKRKMNWILAFIVAVYIPFIVYLSFAYSTTSTSLSSIGWVEGGLRYLIYYIIFTVPLLIYYVLVFMRLSDKKSKWVKLLMLVGSLMIAAGAFFPIREESPRIFHFLHSGLCQAGSGLCMIAVTYMISLYCKNDKINVKAVAILYAELLVFIVISFGFLYTSALFELGASVLFLITVHGMNSKLLKNAAVMKESCNPKEEAVQEKISYSQLA